MVKLESHLQKKETMLAVAQYCVKQQEERSIFSPLQ